MFGLGMEKLCWVLFITLVPLLTASNVWSDSASKNRQFTAGFDLVNCSFSADGGNQFMSLDPTNDAMNPIRLEGEDDKEFVQVEIALGGTSTIGLSSLGLDNAEVRIIYETEWVDGLLIEESTNYFARCEETNAIYYFGEDVSIYEYDDEDNLIETIEGAEAGSWLAGELSENGETINTPGVMMPGTFMLGSRYYQEIAPEVAMDRAENVEMGLTTETPSGTYENCVKIEETTPLEPSAKDYKIYAPGVGIIVDNTIQRVSEFSPQ